jgi:CBS domain-containing protein
MNAEAGGGLRAGEIMSDSVVTVPEGLELRRVADLMAVKRASAVLVTDSAGRPSGVVTQADVLRAVRQTPAGRRRRDGAGASARTAEPRARDIMTSALHSVPDDTAVSRMADLMVRGRIHRVYVTRGGRVVGVVSSMDMLRAITNHASSGS